MNAIAQTISRALTRAEFILKTQQQIAKDFAKFNLNFPSDFEEQPYSKEQIEHMIADRVAALMSEGETRLLQLLYTIDVMENQFLNATTQQNFLQLISEKILFREAYKVYLRSEFKG